MKCIEMPSTTSPSAARLQCGGLFFMTVLPATALDSLTIRPWPDDVIDALGHDPRSAYVETYWLGILGPPSTTVGPIFGRR